MKIVKISLRIPSSLHLGEEDGDPVRFWNFGQQTFTEDHERIVGDWAARHGVTATHDKRWAPCSDWLVYEFTGTKKQLNAFVLDFFVTQNEIKL